MDAIDADQASAFFAGAFGTAVIRPFSNAEPVSLDLTFSRIGGVGILACSTPTGFILEPRSPVDTYNILTSPLGRLDIESERGVVSAQGDVGAIAEALYFRRAISHPGRRGALVRIDRSLVLSRLNAICERTVAPPAFRSDFYLSSRAGAAIAHLAECFMQSAKRAIPEGTSVLADHYLTQALLDLLLNEFDHDQGAAMRQKASLAASRQVKRAVDYMHAHVQEAFTIEDLASVSGVSVRSLQETFRREKGTTPSAYLRRLRLREVHHELVGASGPVNIAGIASKWGFFHPGKFSRYYREVYGCLPSETVRRG